ncbi:peroxisomal targeting signal 2 receptor [Acrasis kona]|uniref:Peroxisomal targeting signal 2 receptor n=1 Tax=Acrasis kona TaxID=1008807 RepID=A0AAW2Z4Q5_9EUKA
MLPNIRTAVHSRNDIHSVVYNHQSSFSSSWEQNLRLSGNWDGAKKKSQANYFEKLIKSSGRRSKSVGRYHSPLKVTDPSSPTLSDANKQKTIETNTSSNQKNQKYTLPSIRREYQMPKMVTYVYKNCSWSSEEVV